MPDPNSVIFIIYSFIPPLSLSCFIVSLDLPALTQIDQPAGLDLAWGGV